MPVSVDWFFRLAKKPKVDTCYQSYKIEAKKLIKVRLDYWSTLCGVEVKRIAIRNQKTRWGSCSSRGDLNFNYKIIFLPVCLMDYIIVHELCHLKELNHSKKFWSLVQGQLPDYEALVRDLKRIEKNSQMRPQALIKLRSEHKCNSC